MGDAPASHTQKAILVHHEEARLCLLFGEAFFLHGVGDALCNSEAGTAGAQAHDGLIAQRGGRLAQALQAAQEASHGDGASALNVIVEAQVCVTVLAEEGAGVRVGEVLELDESVGPAVLHSLHELVHNIHVLLALQPALLDAQVVGTVQQILVVGADVDGYGQHTLGVHASRSHVQGELSNL